MKTATHRSGIRERKEHLTSPTTIFKRKWKIYLHVKGESSGKFESFCEVFEMSDICDI